MDITAPVSLCSSKVSSTNSIDPDEMAHDEPSHIDLNCLVETVFY